MYYTYMLRCNDNSIYTGITTDLIRRFSEHQEQKTGICARYTGSRKVLKIEAAWTSENRETASRLEYRIKKLSKKQKERLIRDEEYFYSIFAEKIDCSCYKRIEIG